MMIGLDGQLKLGAQLWMVRLEAELFASRADDSRLKVSIAFVVLFGCFQREARLWPLSWRHFCRNCAIADERRQRNELDGRTSSVDELLLISRPSVVGRILSLV